MKVEIQEQRSLMKPSPKTTIPDDEDNEVNYNSLRKCSKKKHLSKHKSTSSTLASDSSQHRIAIIQELMSGSSSKKARRNLNFDENYLQCPEQEEEEDEENGEDQEQGYEYEQEDFTQIQQQSQQLKCQQVDDNLDITTVKINKPIAQVDTEKVEEFNLQDQQKQENNKDNTNLNQIMSDKNSNNVLSYSQSDSHQTNMLINPSELIGDISQNFMVCFSQIEGNHQTNSTQVFQNIVIDNSEIITSRNTDQVVLTNNDNDDINIDENIPLMKVDLQPISTETYQQLQETQEIVNEEQNHQSVGGESQGQDNQEAQEIIITKEDKNNCNSNKLEEEEEEMEEVERLLFNPVDDVNFIEDDQEDRFKEEYNNRQDDYGQFLNQENSLPFHQHFFNSEQENNSYNLSEKERTINDNNDPNNNISQPNSSQPILIPPQDTDSFAIPNSQTPQQPLSMEEQLASFEQDEMFGFDEEDKQILEQTEDFFLINADSLLNYRSTFTNFPQKRAILLDWMQEVSSSLSFKRETYQQSVQIMDRFFQQVPLIPKNKIQLVGATALVLAHKMEEVHIWKIEDFIMACNYGFTREQFLEMEQHIWQTLEYRLSCTPGYFWMNQLMLEWDVFSEQFEQLFENDVIFFRKNTQESFRMFSSVCQYLDSVLLNISSYNYSWNSLVASFMYWSLYQSIDITNHPVRLSYLDQIFEQFIANTLRIPSFQHMNLQLNFTSHYLNLNINTAIPTCKKECDPHSQNSNSSQTNNHYQSYENVCSQQIYNQDCLRLFSSA